MFKDEVDIHFDPGDQVAYVPLKEVHELKHPIVEYGFVTSTHVNASDNKLTVFCRFWNKALDDLRTKDNSEGCDWYNLIHCSVADRARVEQAWRTYVSADIVPPTIGLVDPTGARVAPAVGSLATVVYNDDMFPAVVVNVKLEHRVSKSHGRLIRVPVRIDVTEAEVDELALSNLRADSRMMPLYDANLTREQVLAGLPKRRKIVKATFNPRAQLWQSKDEATLRFGAARYRHDHAL